MPRGWAHPQEAEQTGRELGKTLGTADPGPEIAMAPQGPAAEALVAQAR